jgi:hypothetical protein
LRISKLLNHCRQPGIDVLNFRQFQPYPSPEPTPCEVEYVIDQERHAAGVCLYARGNLGVGRMDERSGQKIRAGKDCVQWISQLVAENRDELLAQAGGGALIQQRGVFSVSA